MSLPSKKRRAEEEIVQQMKTLHLEEGGEEERSLQVDQLRDQEVENMTQYEGETATLLHLVETAATKYSLSKANATKVKLISEGSILSDYKWSDFDMRAGEIDMGLVVLCLLRLDTTEDMKASYSLT